MDLSLLADFYFAWVDFLQPIHPAGYGAPSIVETTSSPVGKSMLTTFSSFEGCVSHHQPVPPTVVLGDSDMRRSVCILFVVGC
jgi:hypothetical protein